MKPFPFINQLHFMDSRTKLIAGILTLSDKKNEKDDEAETKIERQIGTKRAKQEKIEKKRRRK